MFAFKFSAEADADFNLSNIITMLNAVAINPYILGIHLQINTAVLKDIEAQNSELSRQRIDVIEHWTKTCPNCSWGTLANAVKKVGGNDNLVKKLEELEKLRKGNYNVSIYSVLYANSNSVSMDGELNDLSGFPSLVF